MANTEQRETLKYCMTLYSNKTIYQTLEMNDELQMDTFEEQPLNHIHFKLNYTDKLNKMYNSHI